MQQLYALMSLIKKIMHTPYTMSMQGFTNVKKIQYHKKTINHFTVENMCADMSKELLDNIYIFFSKDGTMK